ncbi:MAG: diguanylate cyclase [Sulfurimonas sp.]|jgi:diguanylate cyclase (GGDEF)-like protein
MSIKIIFFIFLTISTLTAQTLTFGVFTYRSPEKILKEYQPIADHLSRELNVTIIVKPLSQELLEQEVHEGKIDIIATNPTHYLSLRTQDKTTGSIATLIKRYGTVETPYLGGVIITKVSRKEIRDLEDLRGKTIAIPGKKFLGGYQTQSYELLKNGIDVQDDMKIKNYKNHEAVIKAVLFGKADAGFVRSGILEEMERDKHLNPNELFILNEHHFSHFPLKISTHLYPEWSIVASQKLSADTVAKIAVALYGYHNSSYGYDVISGFTISGDYAQVDQLARTLRIPPYNQAPIFTLNDIWNKYSTTILIVSALIALFMMVQSWMVRKMRFQKAYTHSVLNASPNPMAVSNGNDLIEANQALFDILGYVSLDAFKKEHNCVCDFFQKGDTNEYLLSTMENLTWIEYAQKYPNREHKAKMIIDGKVTFFKVNVSTIQFYKEYRTIAVFTDISSIINQSTTDTLTGLANRLHFNLLFEHAINNALRERSPLSLAFFDIDHFKNVNDTYGHLVGDAVLRHIANKVKGSLRKSDALARWGGEEFVILLPNTSLSSAAGITENIREIIENEFFPVAGHITCSFGVTAIHKNENSNSVLGRVDTLLYNAKTSGRNRVMIG